MARPKLPTDPEVFAIEFEALGATNVAAKYNVSVRNVFAKRKRVEGMLGRTLNVPAHLSKTNGPRKAVRQTMTIKKDKTFLIGSDCHYEANTVTTAHLAFVELAKQLQPDVIVLNGDLMDGASISRHAPLGWEEKPTVEQELNTVTQRLAEIEKAAPNAERFWTMGNHDQRFDMSLAQNAAMFQGVPGFRLQDHFPSWTFCMSLWVEGAEKPVMIKHRFNGGIHAGYNNALKSGVHMVTGHTHQMECKSWSDYNSHRYGVQCGTMADPHQPSFDYAEDTPKNWVSGFVMLTVRDNFLLTPEFVKVHKPAEYEWRGEIHKVDYE